MYADAVVTVVLRAESDPMPQKSEKKYTLFTFCQIVFSGILLF